MYDSKSMQCLELVSSWRINVTGGCGREGGRDIASGHRVLLWEGKSSGDESSGEWL